MPLRCRQDAVRRIELRPLARCHDGARHRDRVPRRRRRRLQTAAPRRRCAAAAARRGRRTATIEHSRVRRLQQEGERRVWRGVVVFLRPTLGVPREWREVRRLATKHHRVLSRAWKHRKARAATYWRRRRVQRAVRALRLAHRARGARDVRLANRGNVILFFLGGVFLFSHPFGMLS